MISVDDFYASEAGRVEAAYLAHVSAEIRAFVRAVPHDTPVALVTVRRRRLPAVADVVLSPEEPPYRWSATRSAVRDLSRVAQLRLTFIVSYRQL